MLRKKIKKVGLIAGEAKRRVVVDNTARGVAYKQIRRKLIHADGRTFEQVTHLSLGEGAIIKIGDSIGVVSEVNLINNQGKVGTHSVPKDEIYLESAKTNVNFTRQGFFSQALAEAEEVARKEFHSKSMSLVVEAGNKANINLYKGKGFERVASYVRTDPRTQRKTRHVVMRKQL
jgi:ribosomal protein S18 acetylase RimI-like enzyme